MEDVQEVPKATYRAVFAVRGVPVLFGGFALLITGDSIKMLALSVLIYARTGSPGLSAAAYMAGFLPHLAGATFLLSLADRLPPRALMIAGELVRAALCLVLAFAGLPVWAMLALVLATGLLTPVFGGARSALLPDLLRGDAFVLGRSVMTVISAGAQIGGLALGGAMLAVAGVENALVLAAVLAVAGAVALRVWLPSVPARGAGPARRDGAVRETLRVNRELLGDGRVRGLLLAMWLPVACLGGAEATLVPYMEGRGTAGVALAAAAAGMAAGSFVVGRLPPPVRERLVLPLACLIGAPLLAFAWSPGTWVAAALVTVATMGMSYELGLQRPFLEAVPRRSRGQAFGLLSSGLATGQAAGAAVTGAAAELLTPHLAIAAAGGCATAAAAGALWSLRRRGGAGVAAAGGAAAELRA
ncbi:MFS transporter [Microbispora sp. NPDC049125]|uniref:MFS transporter n=1 Tax=Microbispora sp. NPDC049125 TaxID=3154929 RepID=UPI00346608D0